MSQLDLFQPQPVPRILFPNEVPYTPFFAVPVGTVFAFRKIDVAFKKISDRNFTDGKETFEVPKNLLDSPSRTFATYFKAGMGLGSSYGTYPEITCPGEFVKGGIA